MRRTNGYLRSRSYPRRNGDWEEAHVGFDATVKGIPPRLRGTVPPGWEYSAWQLVEHLRISQDDILEFCVNPRYRPKQWPDDYWPESPAPRAHV